MNQDLGNFQNVITFIKELERLKDNTRTAWTGEGKRESVAEHSWRLSVFAMALWEYFPDVDINRVIRICLIHDLGEAYEGDVSATLETDQEGKIRKEEKAVRQLLTPLSESMGQQFLDLWKEYNNGETKEAKLAKALDKIETIIQHNQGDNPPDFDYAFNLEYGREYAQYSPVLKAIREIIDRETQERAKENGR